MIFVKCHDNGYPSDDAAFINDRTCDFSKAGSRLRSNFRSGKFR